MANNKYQAIQSNRFDESSSFFSLSDNKVYKVDGFPELISCEDNYLLFNPLIHYWIKIDEIGRFILSSIGKNNSLTNIKQNVIDYFNINDEIFQNDVIPFLENLVSYGFIKMEAESQTFENLNWPVKQSNLQGYPWSAIYLALTDSCNLSCLYCFNKSRRDDRQKNSPHNFASHTVVNKTLIKFKDSGGHKVVFTGGEPLLHPEFVNFCELANSYNLSPSFITNGLLFKNIDLPRLFSVVDSFMLSLDTVDSNEASVLWGKSGTNLERDLWPTLHEIDRLSSKREKKIEIIVAPVVTKINMNSLYETIELLTNNMKSCNVKLSIACCAKINDKKIDESLIPEQNDFFVTTVKTTEKFICNQIKDKQNLSTSERTIIRLSAIRHVLSKFGKMLPSQHPGFLSCLPSLFVTSNGNVYPCQGYDDEQFYMGNVKTDQGFIEMAEIGPFNSVIDSIQIQNREDCRGCEFIRVCPMSCAANLNMNPPKNPTDKDRSNCRREIINQLWLETQLRVSPTRESL